MTDSAYTHITILADRTGSMGQISDPASSLTKAQLATAGILDLIRDQAAQPGKTTFSLTQFNSHGVQRVTWFAPGDDPALRAWGIQPFGGTPLLDATGQVITETGQHLEDLAEDQRPGRVIFVIGTDGEENASREYTLPQVRDMITAQQEKYGWDFVFVGADIDAFAGAGGMGISRAGTVETRGPAVRAAYASTNSAIRRARAGGQSVSYSDDERRRA
jgi:hypothetical protein